MIVDISPCGMDSQTFCRRLLDEYHVAATPGIDFGEHRAERFVRFAYTTDIESLEFALERLGAALAAWGSSCS